MGDQNVIEENLENQQGEEEALLCIYDGDPAFKQISPTIYQYKIGAQGSPETLLLEISWPETYPDEKPVINLDKYYNNHLTVEFKEFVKEQINEKAEQYLGVSVTYTLFELAKEKLSIWFTEKGKTATNSSINTPIVSISSLAISENPSKKLSEKKEHLSKAQKRRQWDKGEAREDKPRGWNWVDVIKHLSQTGFKSTDS